jgi:hypothetical protein
MNENISQQILDEAKDICNDKVKEMYKNWNTNSFSPSHTYSYMYISIVNALLKEEYKRKNNLK